MSDAITVTMSLIRKMGGSLLTRKMAVKIGLKINGRLAAMKKTVIRPVVRSARGEVIVISAKTD